MELSERIIQTLEEEGFESVYEESLSPRGSKPERSVSSPVTIIVTDGSLDVTYNGVIHSLETGGRQNIPVQVPYSLTAGPAGCNFVVAEM